MWVGRRCLERVVQFPSGGGDGGDCGVQESGRTLLMSPSRSRACERRGRWRGKRVSEGRSSTDSKFVRPR